MRRSSLRMRGLGASTALALLAFFAALLIASPARPAPGDIADLAISKSDEPDPVNVGSTLTYAIEVSNRGPQGATEVVVTDRLPSQVVFVSATASSGSCERKGRNVTCKVGSLSTDPTKGNSATVTVQVRPSRPGTLDNTASVDSVETDPLAPNDIATASTTVVPTSSCRGIASTVTGTPGADRLVGTGGPDVIAGRGGGDVIVGLAGRDLICSGGGNDRVSAGSAADRVFGGRGSDRLLGRGGPDLLAGNPGSDILLGHRGGDRLRGGTGFDRCRGGAGFDVERGCER